MHSGIPSTNVMHNGIPSNNVMHGGIPSTNVMHSGIPSTEAAPAGSRFLRWHWPIRNVSSFSEEDGCGSGPSSFCGISAASSFG